MIQEIKYSCDICKIAITPSPSWDDSYCRAKTLIKFTCKQHLNNSLVADVTRHFCSDDCIKKWAETL